MRALAGFIMKGTRQALVAALGFAVLSFVFPPFNFLSAAAIALVTLRRGAAFGMLIWVVTGVAMGVLAYLTNALAVLSPALMSLLILFALMWALAAILRYSRSLPLVLQISGLLAMIFVSGFHVAVGDTHGWWQASLNAFFAEVLQQMTLEQQAAFSRNLQDLAGIMTGFIATAFVLNAVLCLFIGRWWQAMLYNPGGFREEFHQLQLGRQTAVVALAVALLAFLPLGNASLIAKDVLVIVLMLYVLQGLAVAHAVIAIKHLKSIWLVGLYVLVVVMSQMVAIAGYIDTWVDFRKRAAST